MVVVESASKVLTKGERLTGGHLKAAQSAVKLLTLTLETQEELMSLLRESSATTIVTPLQQLLLTINPSTRNSDFILHIAKLVSAGPSVCLMDIVTTSVHSLKVEHARLRVNLAR